tara:strand:+ start:194 stop:931 length:738 start_codon:yes stop_codon:yes gene_type:complete
MSLIFQDFIFGFGINLILILLGFKIPIMTKSGWISSGILGTILWGCLSWKGWLSVVIYLILGSLVTKVGYNFKNKIGIAEKRGGRRGPENVWGSAATGMLLAILIKFNLGNPVYFKIAFSASFAAKLADTFGSEIGKRFGKRTFLITSFKKVKKGSEGGVSLEGTLASLLGSIVMSYVMMTLGFIVSAPQIFIVIVSGFIATIFESIIGAKFQNKYNLSNELVNTIQTSFSAIISIVIYSIYMSL